MFAVRFLKGTLQAFFYMAAVVLAGPVAAQSGSGEADVARPPVEVVYPDWFKVSLLDLPADLKEARDAGKKGLMLFYGTRTCGYCAAFLEKTFGDTDIVRRTREQFDVIALEVISDEEVINFRGESRWLKDFAVEERARFTPTIGFYGEDGKLLLRLVGYVGPDRFSDVLDYLEAGAYTQHALRAWLDQREASQARSAMRPVTRDEALFEAPPLALDETRPGDQPLLVLFERPDCDGCERLHRAVLSTESVRDLLSGFRAVQLDMSDDDNLLTTPAGERLTPKAWAEQLGLLHAPALVFFDEKGSETVRVDSDLLVDPRGEAVGEGNARVIANVEARLLYVLERGYEQQPQFQRWRAARFRSASATQ